MTIVRVLDVASGLFLTDSIIYSGGYLYLCGEDSSGNAIVQKRSSVDLGIVGTWTPLSGRAFRMLMIGTILYVIWYNSVQGFITSINSQTMIPIATSAAFARYKPQGIAYDGTSIWVSINTTTTSPTVYVEQVNPSTLAISQHPIAITPNMYGVYGIAVDANYLYLVPYTAWEVIKVDKTTFGIVNTWNWGVGSSLNELYFKSPHIYVPVTDVPGNTVIADVDSVSMTLNQSRNFNDGNGYTGAQISEYLPGLLMVPVYEANSGFYILNESNLGTYDQWEDTGGTDGEYKAICAGSIYTIDFLKQIAKFNRKSPYLGDIHIDRLIYQDVVRKEPGSP